MIIYTELTKKAMQLAYIAHMGQVDKGGMPYIFHPLHLAEQMDTEVEICVALLHDLLEDTDYTPQDLRILGFSDEIVDAIKYLTRGKAETYREYILLLKKDKIARKVKIADLKHNMDLSRLDTITDKDLDRQKYYAKFLKILEED